MEQIKELSAQFAGIAYTCRDVYPSGWPHCQPKGRKLTRAEWKERRAYAKDAQQWHEGQIFTLGNTLARSVAAREFHRCLKKGFPVKNLAAAARNFSPSFLEGYRHRITLLKRLRIDAASYTRAAYDRHVAFAPKPSFFFPVSAR